MLTRHTKLWASQVALVVKNSAANAGDTRDGILTPGLGRPSGGGRGVFSLGESHGQRSLAGDSPWGHKELNMTSNLAHTYQTTALTIYCTAWLLNFIEIKSNFNFTLSLALATVQVTFCVAHSHHTRVNMLHFVINGSPKGWNRLTLVTATSKSAIFSTSLPAFATVYLFCFSVLSTVLIICIPWGLRCWETLIYV